MSAPLVVLTVLGVVAAAVCAGTWAVYGRAPRTRHARRAAVAR